MSKNLNDKIAELDKKVFKEAAARSMGYHFVCM